MLCLDRACSLLLASLLAFPIPLLPQSPLQEGTVLRSTTRFVQISVIVQGAKSQPITGLKREDFTLYDEGKIQDIAAFSSEVHPSDKKAGPLPFNALTNRFDLLGRAPSTSGRRFKACGNFDDGGLWRFREWKKWSARDTAAIAAHIYSEFHARDAVLRNHTLRRNRELVLQFARLSPTANVIFRIRYP